MSIRKKLTHWLLPGMDTVQAFEIMPRVKSNSLIVDYDTLRKSKRVQQQVRAQKT